MGCFMFATPEICKNALFSCIIFRTKLSKISFCPNLSTRTPTYCYCISAPTQHIVVSCPYNKSGTNNQMYPNVFQYIYGIKKESRFSSALSAIYQLCTLLTAAPKSASVQRGDFPSDQSTLHSFFHYRFQARCKTASDPSHSQS